MPPSRTICPSRVAFDSDVNRDVADDFDLARSAFVAKFTPLDVEDQLEKFRLLYLIRVFFGERLKRFRVATPNFRRPLRPIVSVERFRRRFKERVIVEPKGVFSSKLLFYPAITLAAEPLAITRVSFLPKGLAPLARLFIIDLCRV